MKTKNGDRWGHNLLLAFALLFLMQACCNGFNPAYCLRSPWYALASVLTLVGSIAAATGIRKSPEPDYDRGIKRWYAQPWATCLLVFVLGAVLSIAVEVIEVLIPPIARVRLWELWLPLGFACTCVWILMMDGLLASGYLTPVYDQAHTAYVPQPAPGQAGSPSGPAIRRPSEPPSPSSSRTV